ncbi:MAG: hypothetical protein HY815_05255 [Candidatus Riflebacteria bacterium]|nr:hypothetical protein [Candidatus Riflebacteria bacterium]
MTRQQWRRFGRPVIGPGPAGLSLVEVLVASGILLVLGLVALRSSVSSVKGAGADRAREAVRNLTGDLLERLCHVRGGPTSLFGDRPGDPLVREFSVSEAVTLAGFCADEASQLTTSLESAGVASLALEWQQALKRGGGRRSSNFRLDVLWCRPRFSQKAGTADLTSFRCFEVCEP